MTWPMVPNLGRLGRVDNNDGQLSIWNVSWVARTLIVDPIHVFDANIFHPHKRTLAYSESNIGAGILAIPGYWATRNAFAAHNSAVLIGFVLTAIGMFYLVHLLTCDRGAAAVSAICFAFTPFLFAHSAHVQLLMTAGLPFSMFLFHRFTEHITPGRGAALGAVMAATALFCGYYGIFTDPDGRLRVNRDRHLAPAVDECSLLAVACNRGVGRDRVSYASVSAVYHATARSGISPRVGPGATVLVELERLLRQFRARARVDAGVPAAVGGGGVSRVHRDGFRNRRTMGRAQTTSRRIACDLWRPRLAGVLGFVRPGRLPLHGTLSNGAAVCLAARAGAFRLDRRVRAMRAGGRDDCRFRASLQDGER